MRTSIAADAPRTDGTAAIEALPGAVRHELELRDAALSAATNGIVIVDALAPDYPMTYVNAGFERMTGYTAAEALGRNCRFLQGDVPEPGVAEEFREVLASREAGTVRVRNFRRDGTPFWNQVSLSPIETDGQVTHYVGVQLDVTEQIAAEDHARYLAHCDPLTGLWNRRALQERLERRCTVARREGGELALLYIDLDDFKSVNDTRGHGAGDALLLRVTERLQEVVPAGAFLARQGGDEFSIVLAGGADTVGDALGVADAVVSTLRTPVLVGGEALSVQASIGISVFPRDSASEEELLMHADAAMYAAKREGGAGRRVYAATDGAALPAVPNAGAARASGGDLEAILAGDGIRSHYQPIVSIDGTRVVAYEALARGPLGSALERPDRLFEAARERDLLPELEWACRAAALRGALEAELPRSIALFVNLEPSMMGSPIPHRLRRLVDDAATRLNVVFELTERALTDRPGDVLAAVPRLRAQGFGIALDDVGADPRSVALMPFLRPDIIKLDMHLVQGLPSAASASVVHAVRAEVERTGAMLLAEGVETPEHELTARALGARYGQGWKYGRPEPLGVLPTPGAPAPVRLGDGAAPAPAESRTAFEIVRARLQPEQGSKRLLYSFSKHLEAQVTARSESAVLLSTFQHAKHFTPATRARYRRFGQSAAFVGALGTNIDASTVPGVRGVHLRPDERLRREWNVVVVDPHFAAAFVARDLGDDGPDWERRFEFCMTYDRQLAVEAARSLMQRVTPDAEAGTRRRTLHEQATDPD